MKENYCGACLAIPIAMMGVGVSTYKSKGSEKQRKKQIIIGTLLSVTISLIIWWYFKFYKNCGECA